MLRDKDLAMKKARSSRKVEDWNKARADRNRVGRLVEEAKADFLKEQQEELADDPKKFWRLVKSIVPGKKRKTGKITFIERTKVDGGAIEKEVSEAETADFINDFFSGIGPKLAKDFKDPWEFFGDALEAECPTMAAEYEQVLRLCKDIKISKSLGFSDIPTRAFKDAFRVLVPQLVYMFNLSFVTGQFPDRWKRATIIPLYKGGDKTEVGNYRPVSLLPLPGKVLEKIAL